MHGLNKKSGRKFVFQPSYPSLRSKSRSSPIGKQFFAEGDVVPTPDLEGRDSSLRCTDPRFFHQISLRNSPGSDCDSDAGTFPELQHVVDNIEEGEIHAPQMMFSDDDSNSSKSFTSDASSEVSHVSETQINLCEFFEDDMTAEQDRAEGNQNLILQRDNEYLHKIPSLTYRSISGKVQDLV